MSRQADNKNATSRRSFLRYASLAAAAPILTEAHFAMAAQQNAAAAAASQDTSAPKKRVRMAPPPGAVIISSNENPLGPCKAACDTIAAIAPMGGRYDFYGETGKLTTTFAKQHGLKEEYVSVYAGSSEPLHFTVLAFTSPKRGLSRPIPATRPPFAPRRSPEPRSPWCR